MSIAIECAVAASDSHDERVIIAAAASRGFCEYLNCELRATSEALCDALETADSADNRVLLVELLGQFDEKRALFEALHATDPGLAGIERDTEIEPALLPTLAPHIRTDIRETEHFVKEAAIALEHKPDDPQRAEHLHRCSAALDAQRELLASLEGDEAHAVVADGVPLTDKDRATLRLMVDHRLITTVAKFADGTPEDGVEALQVAEAQFRRLTSFLQAAERGTLPASEAPVALAFLRITRMRMRDVLAYEGEGDLAVVLTPATGPMLEQIEALIDRLDARMGDRQGAIDPDPETDEERVLANTRVEADGVV